MRLSAPPRHPGVLNKSLGFERPLSKAPGLARSWHGQRRSHLAGPSGPPKHVWQEHNPWPACRRAEHGTPGYSIV